MRAIQVLAWLIGAAHAAFWVAATLWERPSKAIHLRVHLPRPPFAVRVGYAGFLASLLYPVLVAVAPEWGYDGPLNWSSPVDSALLGVGFAAWTIGMVALVWASWVMKRYTGIDGMTEGHELVTAGPYRCVRHPIYGCFTAIALGLALIFRSFPVVAAAAAWFFASLWWVDAEEELLASAEGFGDRYVAHRSRTGRFLPKLRL